MEILGGCYCGRIRYRISTDSVRSTNCHCLNCRRAAGAQAVAWITADKRAFVIESGKPVRYQTETGAWRTFCGECGTSLTYEHEARPDDIDITTASTETPELFLPTKDIYLDEKISWVAPVNLSAE